MKKRNRTRPLIAGERELATSELAAVAGGGRDAYFVKVDRETTTPS